VLAFSAALPARAQTTEIKHFDKDLAAHGVSAQYSDAGMRALIDLIRSDVAALRSKAASPGEENRKKLEKMAEAVTGATDHFAAIAASDDLAAKQAAFPTAKAMLFSLRSEVQGKRKISLFVIVWGMLGNLSLKLPYLSPEERSRPLGPAEARLEAGALQDPATGKIYRDPADLTGLSSEQVSRLDVRDDDHLWYTAGELRRLKSAHETAWKALETRLEARVSDVLHAPYSLDRARRVLVFEHIRKVATSPKIDARDLYGQEWKVKWGEEVQTEALANHLYLDLGGKFEDLVYANKGGLRDLILVLDKENQENKGDNGNAGDADSCDKIATLDRLKDCLLHSIYKFDISAHVMGHGPLTQEMLREEPFASLPADGKEALLGREFVTFNESLVEIQPGAAEFEGLGAGPMSSGGATDDRVKRGLALLNYWIQNKDVKDDNNRGLIDRRSSTYVEYMHDLGASLGALKISGNPNLLKIGDAYVRRRGDKIKFTANMLFVPEAFHHATYADAVWMARKIVEMPLADILAAVAATHWPDFQQEVMASRLIARRNAIARAFDVGAPLSYDVAPRVVPLSTPAERSAAVARYQLSIATEGDEAKAVALLEQFMRECGIPFDENGQATFADRVDRWVIPNKGEQTEVVLATTGCEESVLVALFERTIHPAGLARRIWRRVDDKPLKACQPTAKTLGLRSPAR